MKPTKEYTGRSTIRMFNADCMDFMEDCDTYDLAIVDPPYSNETESLDRLLMDMKGKKAKAGNVRTYTLQGAPDEYYFKALKEVSDNQIIWGVNWYKIILGVGRIVWDKRNEGSNFSDCELAYQSFNRKTDKFSFRWNGMLQEDMKNKEKRIHATQKPVKLYKWIISNYSKEGDRILDTHGGSMSIAIACWDLGFDLDICELDTDYFNDAVKRFENHIAQAQLF